MVAKSWNFNSCLRASLVNGVRCINWHSFAIDVDIELVVEGLRSSEESLGRRLDQSEGLSERSHDCSLLGVCKVSNHYVL